MPSQDLITSLHTGKRAGFDPRKHLDHAVQQARERNLGEMLIVDVDAHHYELGESWPEIIKYIESPVIRHRAEAGISLMHRTPVRQSVSGRIPRQGLNSDRGKPREPSPDGVHRDVALFRAQMESIGIDYQVVFPTPMLELGLEPDPEIEVAMSWAYTRWLTEHILPPEPRLKTMVFLPMNDPDAALRAVEYFTGKPGVIGFMVTTPRYRPMHSNVYFKVYRAIEERGLPLGFHASFHQRERMFEGMNRFLSVHALGFVFFSMIHMTNIVINGIPELFPKLKFVWMESGLAWVPFLMQRLNNEYLMRSSEAPLLKKLPSEYIREFYFSTQPMETSDLAALQVTMNMINASSQLMFASDYPHWDFNLPSSVYDLPFLSMEAKRNILGGNAQRLFGLEAKSPAAGVKTAAVVK